MADEAKISTRRKWAARDYLDMPPVAFAHPEDIAALAAARRLPGVEWGVNRLSSEGYEKILRASLLAKAVRAGDGSFALLDEMLREACAALEVQPPELFVTGEDCPRATVAGCGAAVLAVSRGMLELLDEAEMFCLLAHQVSHLHCGHLPYLTLRDFLRKSTDVLGMLGLPLSGPRLALEEWGRRAEFSCDRGMLLLSASADAPFSLLAKLAGAGTRFGAPGAAALAAQREEFVRATRGLGAGRLYRALMYLDGESGFIPVRHAALAEWGASPGCADLRSGRYSGGAAAGGDTGLPLWGEFSSAPGEGAPEPRESTKSEAAYGAFKTAFSAAFDLAAVGTAAFGKALGVFCSELRDRGGAHRGDGAE